VAAAEEVAAAGPKEPAAQMAPVMPAAQTLLAAAAAKRPGWQGEQTPRPAVAET